MAKVKISLSDLRYKYIGAGVYTVISDESVTSQPANGMQVQLIVGSSKVGQVNRPFYIEKGDLKTFRSLFGTIDKTLERRGSFFHRSAETALQSSPILAMNVIPLNNTTHNGNPTAEADTAEYQTFSVDSSKPNCDKRSKLFASYFQKERFYIPKKEYLLATRQSTDKELFSLVNIGSTPLSFIITKASNTKRYDITVRDWYATQGLAIPAFLKPDDLISDSFITVTAVAGDYSQLKYTTLSNDTTFSKYFTSNGLKADMYERFLSDPEVAMKFSVTGSIIPNLIDSDGSPLSIDSLINNNVLSYGVIAAVDEAQLDRYESGDQEAYLDLVGHRLIGSNIQRVNLMSYDSEVIKGRSYTIKELSDIKAAMVQIPTTSTADVEIEYKAKRLVVTFNESYAYTSDVRDNVEVGMYYKGKYVEANAKPTNGGNKLKLQYALTDGDTSHLYVENVIKAGNRVIVWLTNDHKQYEEKDGEENSFIVPDTDKGFIVDTFFSNVDNSYYAGNRTPLHKDFSDGIVKNGDEARYKVNNTGDLVTAYLKFTHKTSNGQMRRLCIEGYKDSSLIQLDPNFGANAKYSYNADGTPAPNLHITISKNTISTSVDVIEKLNTTSFIIADSDASKVRVGNYIVGVDSNGQPALSRINAVKTYDVGKLKIECLGTVTYTEGGGKISVIVYRRFEDLTENLQVFCLGGFNIKPHSLPDGTLTRYRRIMDFMIEGSVGSALLDPEMVNFRYFVDTYAGFVENSAKSYLTRFLSRRQKCLGILNAPSVEAFRKSVSPRFTTTPTAENPLPELSVDYIISGGNVEENPRWLYTLPSEADGASFAGFFFPSVQVRDNDGQIVTCPPAPFVAATMMRKFGTVDAYKPVAGVIRGQLQQGNVVGIDYQLSQDEYRKLIEAHINPMILKSGQVTIYGNKTAYSKFVSALNNIFVRDALIDIQNETEALLEPYVFDYNDDIMRSTVSTVLRKYYSTLRDTYRIIESYELVFDRTNNPDEFIDAGAAVVDVVVTFTSCAQKFISRISIKNRSVSASSFVVV